MRTPFLLLVSFVLSLGGCKSHNPSKRYSDSAYSQSDSSGLWSDSISQLSRSEPESSDSVVLSKLKMRFADLPIPFEGLWVNEHYVNEIRQGKPLRKSQDTQTRCIVIPARTLQRTSLIYGMHDGGPESVLIRDGSDYFTYALYDGRIVDTLKVLTDYRLRIGQDYYIRVGEDDSASSDLGVLEDLLFSGRYRRLDTAGMAIFAKNGKIDGLDSLGWYEPVIDYVGDPTNIDHVRLGKDKKHLNDYGLRFLGDTMMIYSIHCLDQSGGDCYPDTLGRLLYSLARVK